MLNKDLVLRRAAEAAAGIVNQGTTKSFLEETSFFPAPNKTGPVPPPAREESQVVNGEKPKVGNAAAQKWDEILPQGVDLWTRKKESEQKAAGKTPAPASPVKPNTTPKAAALPNPNSKNGGTDFKKEPPTFPSMDKTKNGVAGMPPVKLPTAEPAAGKGKPDLKTPPPLGKPRSDVKTLNAAGVPEIIFQRKGGPAPAATPRPEPSAAEVAFAATEAPPAPAAQFQVIEQFPVASAPSAIIEQFPVAKEQAFEVQSFEPAPMEINEPPASLSRLTSELEKEKEERRRAEQRAASLAGQLQSLHQELGGQLATEQHNQKRIAELEEELRASKAEVEQLRTDSEKLKGDRALAEKQSKIIAELKERLQKALSLFRESHEAFQKSRTELEGSLGTLSLTDPQKSNPFAPID